jgi:hypothetical protein
VVFFCMPPNSTIFVLMQYLDRIVEPKRRPRDLRAAFDRNIEETEQNLPLGLVH